MRYASELTRTDRIRIVVRVNYGYYVIERILLRCFNEAIKQALRNEIMKNMKSMGANSLKAKWLDLVDRSSKGLLVSVSLDDEDHGDK